MRPFTSILVDSNLDNSAFFKTAVRALSEFGDIYSCVQLSDVLNKLATSGKPWDLIFVSYRLQNADVLKFFEAFRQTPAAKDSAVVQIFKMGEASGEKIDAAIAMGFNGILCEPFSGDGLKDCAKQSVKLRLNGTKSRIGITLRNIIPIIAKEIAGNGGKVEKLLNSDHKELSEACKSLRELASFAGNNYEIIINEIFDNLKKRQGDEYGGFSSRLKNKFETEGNVLDRLQQELLEFR